MNAETKNFGKLTFNEAKKSVASMNLIDGFLFDSTLENKDDAKVVMKSILKAVFNKDFVIDDVTSQKSYQAIETSYHGIRFDAYIEEDVQNNNLIATIYDVEMENRESDRKYLPKRFRYYGALHDVKSFESGKDYDELPNFVSVTILSYDPFLAGDMYYEASTRLLTHPNIVYNDGIRHIYLYCNGRPNFDTLDIPVKISLEHSKKLKEMLKYIVTGQKPSSPNTDIDAIENIVAKVKNRKEVIGKYMQQWDRELSLKRDITREVTEEVTREVKEDDALKLICFSRKHHIPEEEIRKSLVNDYDFSVSTIDELLAKADTKETKAVITK